MLHDILTLIFSCYEDLGWCGVDRSSHWISQST